MSNDDRDMEMENRLREALAATADGVQPGGDGLMRIQQRIGVRANRDRWLRPVLVLGSVVVVAVIAVGGVAIARHGGGKSTLVTSHGGQTSTPTPAVSGFPEQGFFPFTTATEEETWQQQFVEGGHSPWISDPVAVSQSWVPYYLLQKHVDEVVDKNVTDTTADVTLGRTIAGTSTVHPVVIVHLVKFDKAWIVTGASAPTGDLTISSPAPGATGNSPLTVTGPGFGVDQRATVEVRDAETPTLLGQAQTGMFGNGTQDWSATVSFSPSNDGFGVIVVSTDSPADGGVGELTAQKVTFTQSSASPSASGFYGVQGGVIEKFGADGAPQGPISGSDSNGTVTNVEAVDGTLYYAAGAAGCASELRSISTDGGTSTLVDSADAGYGILGFDISGDGRSTYFEGGCGSKSGSGQLVMHDQDGKTRVIAFPSLPPVIAAGPVWEADGVHVDAFVRTGMSGYLARYDSTVGTDPMPSNNACSGYDVNNGLPNALATAPDGTLWFAVQTGSSMQVLSCAGGHPTTELTISKNGTPISLSVDASGNVLLADSDGNVWRGTAGGAAAELSSGGGVSAVTW